MRTEITAGDLTAVVGNNEAYGEHRAGYNGLHSLTSVHDRENLFAHGIAGLNLEHLLDGRDMPEADDYFEPRRQPMELERLGERSAQLHQMATPTLAVQSLTTFTLTPPHYVDVEIRLALREDRLRFGYLAGFWASYIRAPEDGAMHFPGRSRDETMGEGWQRLATREHNDHSTVCHVGMEPELENELTSRESLAYNYSHLAFTRPFFLGRRGRMVFAMMFDRSDEVRFSHSPTGGGMTGERVNPAWDFQFVMQDCPLNVEQTLRARMVYKPWVDERDIVQEFERWDPLVVE